MQQTVWQTDRDRDRDRYRYRDWARDAMQSFHQPCESCQLPLCITPTNSILICLFPIFAPFPQLPQPALRSDVNINCIIEHCGLPQTCNSIAPFRLSVHQSISPSLHLSNCPL